MIELTFTDCAGRAIKGDLSQLERVRFDEPLLREIVLRPSLLITSETHFDAFGLGFIWFLLHGDLPVEGFGGLLGQWHPVMYGIATALEEAGKLHASAEDMLMDIELQLPVKFSAAPYREAELPLWMLMNFMRFVAGDLRMLDKGRFLFLRNPYAYHRELALYFSGIRQSLQVGEIIEMTHLSEALVGDREAEVWALFYLLQEEHDLDILSSAWSRLWTIRDNYRNYSFLSQPAYKQEIRKLNPSLDWSGTCYSDRWRERAGMTGVSMNSLNGLARSIPQLGGPALGGIIRRFGLLQANPFNQALREDTLRSVNDYLLSGKATSLGVLTLHVIGLVDPS